MSKKDANWTPENILRLRTMMKITKKELAEKLGASEASVYQWENGNTKPRATFTEKFDELAEKFRQERKDSKREVFGEGLINEPSKPRIYKKRCANGTNAPISEEGDPRPVIERVNKRCADNIVVALVDKDKVAILQFLEYGKVGMLALTINEAASLRNKLVELIVE